MWKDSQKAIDPFFCDYSQAFDPSTPCPGPDTNTRYGYNRAHADTMLAYDALNVLLKGCDSIPAKDKATLTPQNLRDAIAHMKPFQGVTGRIEFVDGKGDPSDKVVVVLRVNENGKTEMDDLQGTPITGSVVCAATTPGRCAAPPAPAIITFIPLLIAFFANAETSSGTRCAESA